MQRSGKCPRGIALLLVLPLLMVGCASFNKIKPPPPSPPYFKEVYETSKNAKFPDAGLEGAAAPEATGTKEGATTAPEPPKPQVRIINIPNPLVRETVKAPGEKTPLPSLTPGAATPQAAADELQKPIELSAQAAAGDVQILVENMPLYDFVNVVFGEILKINYTISPEVQSAQERITLNMNQKIPGKQFFPFAVDLMRKNNLDVREDNGVISISKKPNRATIDQMGPSSEIYIGELPPGLPPHRRVTLIMSTNYVPAPQILQIIRQVQIFGGDVKTEVLQGVGQAMALTGTVSSLQKVTELFQQLDRITFAKRDFNLIYLDYINVGDFDKKIKEVLPVMGIPIAYMPSDPGLLTIPFEKINALLIVTAKKEWVDAVRLWKGKLDAVESMGDEMQLFVYLPKNRPAAELVEVLKAVSSGGIVPAISGGRNPSQQPATATSAPGGKSFTAVLDKGRNAIIISANPTNFKLVHNILEQLDTQPKQVLIECTIAELTLTDQLQFGLEWYIKQNINSNKYGDFAGVISTLGGLNLGGAGLNYTITKLSGDFQAKINMFAKKDLINIISTPHIVLLDGKDATINVGTDVPIVTAEMTAADLGSTSTSTGATTPSILRSVQYRTTGVTLKVKPVVNSDGVVTIEINQELSEAQINSVSTIDSPMILKRSISTTLAVNSGETVLLGGLISTNKSQGESKVPFLGDIPILGRFFKTDSTGTKKTELIVQLTPYILNDLGQLDEITKRFKQDVFLKGN